LLGFLNINADSIINWFPNSEELGKLDETILRDGGTYMLKYVPAEDKRFGISTYPKWAKDSFSNEAEAAQANRDVEAW
jgi:hypothetical protein